MLQDSQPPYAPNILRFVAGLEAMTRLTELHIKVPSVNKQEDLQGLTRLKSLALDYEPESRPQGTTCHAFVFPEAASITKLRLYIGNEAKEVRIHPLRRDLLSARNGTTVKIIAALCPMMCLLWWAQPDEQRESWMSRTSPCLECAEAKVD